MINLESNFTHLYESALSLYGDTLYLAVILITIGFALKVGQSMFGDPGQMLRALLGVSVAGLMILVLPELINDLQLLAHAFAKQLDTQPQSIHKDFAELILRTTEGDGVTSFGLLDLVPGIGFGLGFNMGDVLSYGLVFLASQCAWAIGYLYHWLQQILLIFGIAVSPLFIAFCTIDTLRPVAHRFFLGLASVAFWPYGVAVAHMVTKALMQTSVDGDGILGSNAFWAVILLTIWILFASIAAPLIVSKMVSSGANAGTLLIKSFATTLAAAATGGIGGYVTPKLMHASTKVAAASAATSAGASFVSGAAGGNGALPTAFIGASAGFLAAKGGQSTEDYRQRASEIYKQSKS